MPYSHRVDGNQVLIVAVLRAAGASVEDLSDVGRGVTDLLVGYAGANFLLEIKTHFGHLSTMQIRWHERWRGQVAVVRTPAEALAAIGADVREIPTMARSVAQTK